MKNKFVNEYEYNLDTFKARLKIIFYKYSSKIRILLYFLLIDLVIMSLFSEGKNYFYYIVITIALIISTVLIEKFVLYISAKKVKDKFQIQDFNITIDKKKKLIIVNNKKTLDFSYIVSVSQNKNWLIINIRGGYFFMLKKDGFKSSTSEDCYHYLEKIAKKNKQKDKMV